MKTNWTLIREVMNGTIDACAEIVGLSDEDLKKEMPHLEPHCGTGGKAVEEQLQTIPKIQNGWMLTGIAKALEEYRAPSA